MKRIFIAISILLASTSSLPCTTLKMTFGQNVLVGRNLDWPHKSTYLLINARGTKHVEKELSIKSKALSWTSQVGSVTFDMANNNQPNKNAVAGGINTEGVVASILWLSDSSYPTASSKTELQSGLWAQYILDNAKTVHDAIALMKNIDVEPSVINNQKIQVHLMVSDAFGNTAIFEYINGKLKIYTDKTLPYPVLTNTSYEHAVAYSKQFKHFGGDQNLPGGYYTKQRFVLAANFLRLLSQTNSLSQAIAYNFEALGYLIELPGTESPTQWSAVYDLKNKVIYYRDIDNQNIRYLKLSNIDFSGNKKYKPLLINNQFSGNLLPHF